MRRTLVLGWIALFALAPAAFAGCGGDGGEELSQDEYQQRLDDASADLRQTSDAFGEALGDVVSGESNAGQAASDALGRVGDQIRETASELEGVEPPEDAREANDQLVDALRAYADDLSELEEPLESGSPAEIQQRLGELDSLDSVQELEEAARRLQDAGYSFET